MVLADITNLTFSNSALDKPPSRPVARVLIKDAGVRSSDGQIKHEDFVRARRALLEIVHAAPGTTVLSELTPVEVKTAGGVWDALSSPREFLGRVTDRLLGTPATRSGLPADSANPGLCKGHESLQLSPAVSVPSDLSPVRVGGSIQQTAQPLNVALVRQALLDLGNSSQRIPPRDHDRDDVLGWRTTTSPARGIRTQQYRTPTSDSRIKRHTKLSRHRVTNPVALKVTAFRAWAIERWRTRLDTAGRAALVRDHAEDLAAGAFKAWAAGATFQRRERTQLTLRRGLMASPKLRKGILTSALHWWARFRSQRRQEVVKHTAHRTYLEPPSASNLRFEVGATNANLEPPPHASRRMASAVHHGVMNARRHVLAADPGNGGSSAAVSIPMPLPIGRSRRRVRDHSIASRWHEQDRRLLSVPPHASAGELAAAATASGPIRQLQLGHLTTRQLARAVATALHLNHTHAGSLDALSPSQVVELASDIVPLESLGTPVDHLTGGTFSSTVESGSYEDMMVRRKLQRFAEELVPTAHAGSEAIHHYFAAMDGSAAPLTQEGLCALINAECALSRILFGFRYVWVTLA